MNLELNVVRFENEDVIATSGVCAHLNAENNISILGHINVIDLDYGEKHRIRGTMYNYKDGSLKNPDTQNFARDMNLVNKVDSLGWYHLENGVYEKCDPNAEHPIAE